MSGDLRFQCTYSFLQKLVRLKTFVRLHVPIVGTFKIEACFDSLDATEKVTAPSSGGGGDAVTTVLELKPQQSDTQGVQGDTIDTIDIREDEEEQSMCTEEKAEFQEWRRSFDTNVVPELNDFWTYRKNEVAEVLHRESLESVVSQINELKPYLEVGEEVYCGNQLNAGEAEHMDVSIDDVAEAEDNKENGIVHTGALQKTMPVVGTNGNPHNTFRGSVVSF